MAIDYTAWPTPAEVFALLTSANITPTLAVGSDLTQLRIDAAAKQLTKATHREFIAGSAGEIRFYDGSGSGIQIIDEYVDVTDVSFFQYPLVATVSIASFLEFEQATFAKNKIYILQGPSNIGYGYLQRFPQGRANIQVTATFGYASTIPADVWQAVLYQAAANIANTNSLGPNGKVESWDEADVKEKYGSGPAAEMAGWEAEFKRVCKDYKRPLRQFLQRNRPRMI